MKCCGSACVELLARTLLRIRSLGFPLLQSIGKMILEDNLKYPTIVTSAKFTMFGCEWCLSC
jgi:hypothetical protein